jgi:hypothetical protein
MSFLAASGSQWQPARERQSLLTPWQEPEPERSSEFVLVTPDEEEKRYIRMAFKTAVEMAWEMAAEAEAQQPPPPPPPPLEPQITLKIVAPPPLKIAEPPPMKITAPPPLAPLAPLVNCVPSPRKAAPGSARQPGRWALAKAAIPRPASAPVSTRDGREGRLLAPLAYLLQPLVEELERSSRGDQSHATLALNLVLSEVRLAQATCAPEGSSSAESGGSGPSVAAKLRNVVAAATVTASAARRVRSVVSTLLSATTSDAKEVAVVELTTLSSQPQRAPILAAIVEEGGVAPLVELVASPGATLKIKQHAVSILRRIADHSKVYRTAIAQAGGIAPLVKLVAQLGGNATLAKARQEAAVALANLARAHGANQSAIAAAGAVPALVRLLRSTEELDQLAGASAMCALVAQHADNARLVVQEKGVAPLVRFVLPIVFAAAPRTGSVWPAAGAGASAEALHKLLEQPEAPAGECDAFEAAIARKPKPSALSALKRLSAACPSHGQPALSPELLGPLVALAQTTKVGAEHAVATLLVLERAYPKEVIDAGAINVFENCLRADPTTKAPPVIVHSAGGTLRRLVTMAMARDAIMATTTQLVELLRLSSVSAQAHVTAVIASLVCEPEGRKAVAAAGAASPLVQLACSASVEVQQEAIGILCQLAHQSHELPSLVEAGVVPPLVAQLHSSEAGAAVATALEQLSCDPAGRQAIAGARGIEALVSVVRSERPVGTRAHALQAVLNLARSSATLGSVASDAEVVGACVHVLTCATSDASMRSAAAATLWPVATAGRREAIATAGGVEALLTLLGIEGESELHAVRALHVLADYAGSHGALAGGLESLVSLTARSSEGEGGRLAVLTVHKMAASGDEIAASALASSGATIALLVKQVREGSVEEQTAAARSLRFLCAHEASRAGESRAVRSADRGSSS